MKKPDPNRRAEVARLKAIQYSMSQKRIQQDTLKHRVYFDATQFNKKGDPNKLRRSNDRALRNAIAKAMDPERIKRDTLED